MDLYDFGARNYDPALGRWLNVDPLAEVQPNKTPYHYTSNNPINRIDPTGMLDHEYDKDGNKISNLGGNKIDFHHQANGDTKITDKQTGSSNIIAGGESLIRDYAQRNKDTSWGTLFKEFDTGGGPTNSLISDFDNSNTGIFGSMNSAFSTYASKARSAVLSDGQPKGGISFNYKEVNPLTAGFDGWEQFLGRANMSYYTLGDKVLFMINDSKSAESLLYRASPSWERNSLIGGGTTKQTYIWTESINEVRQKTQIKQNHIQSVRNAREIYKATETQRPLPIKF